MIPKRLETYFDYNDSYPTCSRTHATFCVFLPETIHPDELTERFGIQPSRTRVKGEVYKGKVREWPTSWFLESEGKVDSKDVRRHIDWILEQIKNKSEIIKQLQTEGSQIHLSCFWGSAVGHGGPMLDAGILKRIALLNIGISFDIYFEGDEESNIDEPRLQ